MKRVYIILLLVTGCFISGYTQNVSQYFQDIANGDVSDMTARFSNDMEICVNNTQEFMDKPQAIKAVNNFLAKVKPISASELHQGSSKSKSSQYRVGQLKTAQGNYRVFIYIEGEKKKV